MKMIAYFEDFGVDLGPFKDNPFERYETDKIVVTPIVINPDTNYRVILSSNKGYAEVVYSRIVYGHWSLLSKSEHSGPGGKLPPGYSTLFGMQR